MCINRGRPDVSGTEGVPPAPLVRPRPMFPRAGGTLTTSASTNAAAVASGLTPPLREELAEWCGGCWFFPPALPAKQNLFLMDQAEAGAARLGVSGRPRRADPGNASSWVTARRSPGRGKAYFQQAVARPTREFQPAFACRGSFGAPFNTTDIWSNCGSRARNHTQAQAGLGPRRQCLSPRGLAYPRPAACARPQAPSLAEGGCRDGCCGSGSMPPPSYVTGGRTARLMADRRSAGRPPQGRCR